MTKKSIEAKEKYLEKKYEEIDVLMKTGRKEAAYKTVKKFFGTHNPKSGAIEDREGTVIYEQEHIAERWKEYLEAPYNKEELTG